MVGDGGVYWGGGGRGGWWWICDICCKYGVLQDVDAQPAAGFPQTSYRTPFSQQGELKCHCYARASSSTCLVHVILNQDEREEHARWIGRSVNLTIRNRRQLILPSQQWHEPCDCLGKLWPQTLLYRSAAMWHFWQFLNSKILIGESASEPSVHTQIFKSSTNCRLLNTRTMAASTIR